MMIVSLKYLYELRMGSQVGRWRYFFLYRRNVVSIKNKRYHTLRESTSKGMFRNPKRSMLPLRKASPKPKDRRINSNAENLAL
jgi:hypothetical protein